MNPQTVGKHRKRRRRLDSVAMDEGRLAVVLRQEEQHRKFVYVMNEIVRSQLGLYNSCLVREEHEASVKLVKNCVEVSEASTSLYCYLLFCILFPSSLSLLSLIHI